MKNFSDKFLEIAGILVGITFGIGAIASVALSIIGMFGIAPIPTIAISLLIVVVILVCAWFANRRKEGSASDPEYGSRN